MHKHSNRKKYYEEKNRNNEKCQLFLFAFCCFSIFIFSFYLVNSFRHIFFRSFHFQCTFLCLIFSSSTKFYARVFPTSFYCWVVGIFYLNVCGGIFEEFVDRDFLFGIFNMEKDTWLFQFVYRKTYNFSNLKLFYSTLQQLYLYLKIKKKFKLELIIQFLKFKWVGDS